MGFDISASFMEEFDFAFHEFLQQEGSVLLPCVSREEVHGAIKYIRQAGVGEAHWVSDVGGITEHAPVMFDRRRLKPRPFACPLAFNDFDMVMQGSPDPELLAQEAANSCGKLIDKLIIHGIGGEAYTESEGVKKLPGAEKVTSGTSPAAIVANYDKTQTIAWNDCTMGGPLSGNNNYVNAGLNSAKINKAVAKLRSKFNTTPIVCVSSNKQLAMLRADARVANSDFNDYHAFMAGHNLSYGGVAAYVASEVVDSGKSVVNNTGTYESTASNRKTVEYAYVFCPAQIKLGISMALHLETAKNPERYMQDELMYKGMYDCTRMFEESVVRIELLNDVTGLNNPWAA